MIKTIIFDVGGVLQKNVDNWIVDEVISSVNLDKPRIEQALNQFGKLLTSGKMSEKALWKKITGKSKTSDIEIYLSIFRESYLRQFNQYEDVLKIVRNLKQKGFNLAILSNTIKSHADINYDFGLYDYFDQVILSYKINLMKPDQTIYKYAIEILNTSAKNTVFIDDKITNVEIASNMGMNGILFRNSKQLKRELNRLNINI